MGVSEVAVIRSYVHSPSTQPPSRVVIPTPPRIITSVEDAANYLVSLSRSVGRGRAIYVVIDPSVDPTVLKFIREILTMLGFRRVNSFPGMGLVIKEVSNKLVVELYLGEDRRSPIIEISVRQIAVLHKYIMSIIANPSSLKLSSHSRSSHSSQGYSGEPLQGRLASHPSGDPSSQDRTQML